MYTGLFQDIHKVCTGPISQRKHSLKLMSKPKDYSVREAKLKTKQSMEIGYQSRLQKSMSFTKLNSQQTIEERQLNPEASRRSVGLRDLDLKGKLTEHKWKPICRNANQLKQQNTPLIIKRKDHFLTVVSRLPIYKHKQKAEH